MIDGTTVMFGGTAEPGQIAGILVDGTAYAYRVRIGDTNQSVAANLATMARQNSVVQMSQGSLTIPGARLVVLSGVAHLPPMERPAEFTELVTTFLTEAGV